MSAISFFIDDQDLAFLMPKLNAGLEITFIVPDVLPGVGGRGFSSSIRSISTGLPSQVHNIPRDPP